MLTHPETDPIDDNYQDISKDAKQINETFVKVDIKPEFIDLNTHLKIEHKDQSNHTSKKHLNNHIKKVHEGKNVQKCDSCDKSFTSKKHLKNHIMKVHEGKNVHKCDSCGKNLTSEKFLKNHIKRNHEGKNECEVCGKCFPKAWRLKVHIRYDFT